MAGKVSYRLNPETRILLPGHEDFYAGPLGLFASGQSPLKLKAKDPEARTETEVKANGDVEVTLVIPFDNNEVAADGRIYLKDRFLFDPTQKVLKDYGRSFESSHDAPAWKGLLAKYQGLLRDRPKLNDPKVLRFALEVARTHSQPMVDENGQTLKKFSAAFQREHAYLDSAHRLIRDQGQAQGLDLKLRIKGEKENHYQVLHRPDGEIELILRFAADGDESGTNGRIWLKDRFLFREGKLSSFNREWSLDPRPGGDPNFAPVLASLQNQAGPDMAEVRAFGENLYPELVTAENPQPQDLHPLLTAASKAPPAESAFQDRRRDEVSRRTEGDILEILRVFAVEEIDQRIDAAQGWLGFGSGEPAADQNHVVALFQEIESALERGRQKLPRLLADLPLSPGPAALLQHLKKQALFGELSALAQEHDSELRQTGLLRLASKLLDRGYVGTALNIAERLREVPELRSRAGRLVDFIRGRADFGSKFEFATRNFSKEMAKPSMLIGMMAAPLGGVAIEALGLRGARWLYDIGKIQRIGRGFKVGASVGGMFGESLAFTGVHRIYERLWHGSDTAWSGAGQEIGSSMLLFGAMRAAHGAGGWTQSRMAEGKLNFRLGAREIRFGGRQGAESYVPDLTVATPTGRMMMGHPWVPEAGFGRPTLSPLGSVSVGLLHHFGGIAAMQLAGWGSQALGLAPVSHQSFFGDSFDSALGYFQALIGFRMANRATQGKLQASMAEIKMRAGSVIDPDLPAPRNPLARFGLYSPNVPELRAFDFNQGGARYDFRILPGRETSLDMLFFGDQANRIMVGMDQQGVYLFDRRPQVSTTSYQNIPAHHARIVNYAEQALLFNRTIMPNQTRIPLAPGDTVRLGMRHLQFAQPRFATIFHDLLRLDPRQQMRLGARIDAANDIEGLIGAFHAEGLDLRSVSNHVRKVWNGEELLYGLPVELGLQSKVHDLIQAELRRGEREGLDELAVQMKPRAIHEKWSPVEKSFQINQAIEKLQARLKEATSILEMMHLLRGSPFDAIEGRPTSEIAVALGEIASRQRGEIQDLPYTAGIRQQVRDAVERDNYWAAMRQRDDGQPLRPRDPTMQAEYNQLHQKHQAIFDRIRNSQTLRDELPASQLNRLTELVHQVLERGQPVEILPSADGLRGMVQMYQYDATQIAERLYPVEMNVRIDPWTGERIDPANREAHYRLAFHVLNFGANRPVLGVPSHHERQECSRLVSAYLDRRAGGNFLQAQKVLREHLDRATPEARAMLREAGPEERATVLGLYFGPFRRRDLAPATAYQVSTWMGQAGMFREVGVTYEIRHDSLRSTLSLGNLGNVEPQHRDDFFSLHTHPEVYVGPGGRRMGYETAGHVNTIILGNAGVSRSTLNILPSQVDLKLYHEKAREYWRVGHPLRFGETALFLPDGNRFRNWVIHSLGLSKVDVRLDDQGRPIRIEVSFAARRLARLLNSEYQRQKEALEGMSAVFGIPVVVSMGDYASLMAEMPYGTRSLFDNR